MKRIVMLILLSLQTPAMAQVITFAWDNDVFFGTDANYTNGIRLSWRGPETPASATGLLPSSLQQLMAPLPGVSALESKGDSEDGNSNRLYSLGISIEQLMITPSDLTLTTPQFDDTPYAGLLRADVSLFARDDQSVTGYSLSVGATGNHSGAAQSQKQVHRWTDSELPRGWNTQLPDRHVFGIAAVHARLLSNHGSRLQRQTGVAAGGRIDTWIVSAQTGAFVRVGQNLDGNILPDYTGIGTPASLPGLTRQNVLGWSLYAGISAEGIAWSYVQSEGRKAGYTLDNEDAVIAGIAGASLSYQQFMMSLSMQKSSSYSRNRDRYIQFGTIAFVWMY